MRLCTRTRPTWLETLSTLNPGREPLELDEHGSGVCCVAVDCCIEVAGVHKLHSSAACNTCLKLFVIIPSSFFFGACQWQ